MKNPTFSFSFLFSFYFLVLLLDLVFSAPLKFNSSQKHAFQIAHFKQCAIKESLSITFLSHVHVQCAMCITSCKLGNILLCKLSHRLSCH